MANTSNKIGVVVLNNPQLCQVCGGNNPGGYNLPSECIWCIDKVNPPKVFCYAKPIIKKLGKMNFPVKIIEATGTGTVCRQCSSCHNCR